MKTLTVIAYEWFDKVNGNSYFSAEIFADNILISVLPFQYGYGNHYEDMAAKELYENGTFPDLKQYEWGGREGLHTYCQRHNIELLTRKHENCKQRELKSIGAQKIASVN